MRVRVTKGKVTVCLALVLRKTIATRMSKTKMNLMSLLIQMIPHQNSKKMVYC